MQLACVVAGKDNFRQWFAELNVDLDKVSRVKNYFHLIPNFVSPTLGARNNSTNTAAIRVMEEFR